MIGSAPPAPALRLGLGASSDLDGIMSVMTAAFDPRFGEAWTRSQCAGILPMSGVSLMLARDGVDGRDPLGFALFRTVAGEAELLLIAVAPGHHRRGIGRAQARLLSRRRRAVRRADLRPHSVASKLFRRTVAAIASTR